MTYRLACELSHKIKAAAPFVGHLAMKNPPETCNLKDYKDGMGWWDTETCTYEVWKGFPDFYTCNQAKEIPMMITHGL